MAWPMIAMAAAKPIAQGLSSWFLRPKVPKAQDTAVGMELMRRSSEGVYGPIQRRRVMSEMGRASGAAAQTASADIRGGLIRRGMDDSIAGERLTAMPRMQSAGLMADTAERMAAADEAAKQESRMQFSVLRDRQDESRRESRRQALAGLFGGVVEGATAAAGQYGQEKMLGEYESFNRDLSAALIAVERGDEGVINEFYRKYGISIPGSSTVSAGTQPADRGFSGGVLFGRRGAL